MSDFRKKMHIAYKQELFFIILRCVAEIFEDVHDFRKDPEEWIRNWINKNCLPQGDFSPEEAIKEIEKWNNNGMD